MPFLWNDHPIPADCSDMAQGHFLGLGPSSNQDTLLVYIEPKPPTKYRGGNVKGSSMPKAKEERRRHNPIIFEYVHLMDKTTIGSNTGSVLWKQEGRHGDYGKLNQAHVLKLGGSGTGLIALALSPSCANAPQRIFPRCTASVEGRPLRLRSHHRYYSSSRWALPTLRQVGVRGTDVPDVPFVLDCVYHPMLVRPLAHDADGSRGGAARCGCGLKTSCESSCRGGSRRGGEYGALVRTR
ncbi:hypothetical protein EDB89DRAFT_255591 [Lactarius sanguifluus]|nr:hypothetical protein EDB89DRAFT_255591 [Lactarius sanguifluus]